MELVILFDDQTEVRYGHARKALVLKSKIEKPFPLRAVRETILKNLPEERGLARPAHADNRDRFVGDSGDVNVAPREFGYGLGERVDDFPAYEVAHIVLPRRTICHKLVRFKRTEIPTDGTVGGPVTAYVPRVALLLPALLPAT